MATPVKKRTTAKKKTVKKKKTTPRGQQSHTAKGRMRREKLRSAAAKLLKKYSYHDLTLEMITSNAEIPTSVFYHYFSNKRELVLELLDEVFDQFEQTVIGAGPYGSFENGLIAHNRELLKLYSDNSGLMRCLNEVEEREFAQSWRKKLETWHERVMRGLSEFAHPKFHNQEELKALALTVSGVTETIANELYVTRNPSLRSLLPDIETATAFLATFWVRALFLKPSSKNSAGLFKTLQHLHDIDQ